MVSQLVDLLTDKLVKAADFLSGLAFGFLLAIVAGPASARAAEPVLATRLDLTGPAEGLVQLEVEDSRSPNEAFAVTAATVVLDGKPNGEILLFPGSGRDRYEAARLTALGLLVLGTAAPSFADSYHWRQWGPSPHRQEFRRNQGEVWQDRAELHHGARRRHAHGEPMQRVVPAGARRLSPRSFMEFRA